MGEQFSHDVLIIGSGAAGLTLALSLSDTFHIALLSKGTINNGATWYAQGGIAAVLDDEDTIEAHVRDTLIAGSGLCHLDVVHNTVSRSRGAIKWLINQGVNFTRNDDDDGYHLTQEGGHSHRRIIHSADATGRAVQKSLVEKVRAKTNVDLFEHHMAVDLISLPNSSTGRKMCSGAYVLNCKTEQVDVFRARAVILATGGASKVYLYTTNPESPSGDGIAMAWRAGCRIGNMEFNQFHPTCLYDPNGSSFLITEAIRGEGGKLQLPDGSSFMHRFDDRLELAPRDIVARAIDYEMKRLGCDCLYLDISHKPDDFIKSHFPTIYKHCLGIGIDITQERIPIVPAAHYTCGGILVNTQGQTDLDQLYAIGEATFTGLHGANRMASNSLLECIVYAQATAEHIAATLDKVVMNDSIAHWDESLVTDSDEDVVISHNWEELRRFMWDYVGIVRTQKRLERATHRIKLLQKEIQEYYCNYKISNDLIELRNLAMCGELIIRSATQRQESRGLHYSLDYTEQLPVAADTILVPANFAGQKIYIAP